MKQNHIKAAMEKISKDAFICEAIDKIAQRWQAEFSEMTPEEAVEQAIYDAIIRQLNKMEENKNERL